MIKQIIKQLRYWSLEDKLDKLMPSIPNTDLYQYKRTNDGIMVVMHCYDSSNTRVMRHPRFKLGSSKKQIKRILEDLKC